MPQSHVEIIKGAHRCLYFFSFLRKILSVLERRRFKLRDQIKLLREKEKAVAGKARSTGRSSASELLKLRLPVLSNLNVDPDQLAQDHLSNISDFRIQTKSSIRPAKTEKKEADAAVKKKNPRKEAAEILKKQEDEWKLACKQKNETMLRNANLKYLKTSLLSFINVCGRVNMVSRCVFLTQKTITLVYYTNNIFFVMNILPSPLSNKFLKSESMR